MTIVQCKLRNKHNETLVTWLDKKPQLKVGADISLKDYRSNTRWMVEEIYPGEHEAGDFDFHRKWDNNNYDKHKGLFNG